jgi:hypothetical protein
MHFFVFGNTNKKLKIRECQNKLSIVHEEKEDILLSVQDGHEKMKSEREDLLYLEVKIIT